MVSGGGGHRGSVFRLLVGEAIRGRGEFQDVGSWGFGSDPGKAAGRFGRSRQVVMQSERPLEVAVSQHIRTMPFLWINVEDSPNPGSDRGVIERNSIALLSNYAKSHVDPPSTSWLGLTCGHERVRTSGLWNNNHVDEEYDPMFFAILRRYIDLTDPA
jgi:hypothetical protein